MTNIRAFILGSAVAVAIFVVHQHDEGEKNMNDQLLRLVFGLVLSYVLYRVTLIAVALRAHQANVRLSLRNAIAKRLEDIQTECRMIPGSSRMPTVERR